MARNTKRTRGYLLLDIAVGGALVAVVVGTVLSVMVHARARNVQSARDVVASQLVSEELTHQQALGFSGVTASGPATVAGETGVYTRTVVVTGPTSETSGAVTMRFKSVSVTVTYVVNNNAKPIRTFSADTRVYQ